MKVVYDAGALIAADRGDSRMWKRHLTLLRRGHLPVTTSPVVAQVSRSPRQARLRLLLAGCEVVALNPADMHRVGALLAESGTSDVIDAHLAHVAIRRRAEVVTSDPDDIHRLLAAGGRPALIHEA